MLSSDYQLKHDGMSPYFKTERNQILIDFRAEFIVYYNNWGTV